MPPTLLQPTSQSYCTGGFIYNERIAAHGCVTLQTLEHDALRTWSDPAGRPCLVDSLLMRIPPPLMPGVSAHRPRLLIHHLECLAHPAQATPERDWLKLSGGAIATSSFMAERIRALEPGLPVERCTPGVDTSWITPQTRRPLRGSILSVGHIIERKGYLLAACAVAEASRHLQEPWSWSIVGDERFEPEYARKFRDELETLGIAQHVHLRGPLSPRATAAAYRDADVFLLCPSFEAYGMVFAEALAAGLPIVATDTGEVRRLVPTSHGTICRPGDPSAIARALCDWIDHDAPTPAQPPRTWDDVAREFATAWQRLLGAR